MARQHQACGGGEEEEEDVDAQPSGGPRSCKNRVRGRNQEEHERLQVTSSWVDETAAERGGVQKRQAEEKREREGERGREREREREKARKRGEEGEREAEEERKGKKEQAMCSVSFGGRGRERIGRYARAIWGPRAKACFGYHES